MLQLNFSLRCLGWLSLQPTVEGDEAAPLAINASPRLVLVSLRCCFRILCARTPPRRLQMLQRSEAATTTKRSSSLDGFRRFRRRAYAHHATNDRKTSAGSEQNDCCQQVTTLAALAVRLLLSAIVITRGATVSHMCCLIEGWHPRRFDSCERPAGRQRILYDCCQWWF